MPETDAGRAQHPWRGRRWIGGSLLFILRAVDWIQSGLAVAEMPNDWESTKLMVGKVADAVDFGPVDAVVIVSALGIAFGPEMWRWGRRILSSRFSRRRSESESVPLPDIQPEPALPPEPESAVAPVEPDSPDESESAPPPEPERTIEFKIDYATSRLSLYGVKDWGLNLYVSVRPLRAESAFIRSVSVESTYGEWLLWSECSADMNPLDLEQEFTPGNKVAGLIVFECPAIGNESIFDHQFDLTIKVAGEPDYKVAFRPVRSDAPSAINFFLKEV